MPFEADCVSLDRPKVEGISDGTDKDGEALEVTLAPLGNKAEVFCEEAETLNEEVELIPLIERTAAA